MTLYHYGTIRFAQANTEITISKDDLNLGTAPDGVSSADVAGILNAVYIIAGIVAIIAIIIGGLRYTVSNGDSSGIQAAKNTIMYAVAGLVVVIAAAAITDFVIKNVA